MTTSHTLPELASHVHRSAPLRGAEWLISLRRMSCWHTCHPPCPLRSGLLRSGARTVARVAWAAQRRVPDRVTSVDLQHISQGSGHGCCRRGCSSRGSAVRISTRLLVPATVPTNDRAGSINPHCVILRRIWSGQSVSNKERDSPDWRIMERNVPERSSLWSGIGSVMVESAVLFCMTK